MGEQQGLLDMVHMDVVSTLADDAYSYGYAEDGTPGWEVRGIGFRIGLVPGILSFSPPNRVHHGLTNSCKTAFHGTVASPSLPETRSRSNTRRYCSLTSPNKSQVLLSTSNNWRTLQKWSHYIELRKPTKTEISKLPTSTKLLVNKYIYIRCKTIHVVFSFFERLQQYIIVNVQKRKKTTCMVLQP